MRIVSCVILFLMAFASTASDSKLMDIGIYRDVSITKIQVDQNARGYDIYGDSIEIGHLYSKDRYTVKVASGKCYIYKGETLIGGYDTIRFVPNHTEAEFSINPIAPNYRSRIYYGELQLAVEDGRKLHIVNRVPLHYYLAGVIESESGAGQSLEYYKVQAIISRTYALKNIYKHAKEGFMLTDLVNCQVYKSKARYNKEIYEAVSQTDGIVIVDEELSLITAAFYSNSGGQTANSEDVWNNPLPYLRSIKDPYSEGQNNASWTKRINRMEWLQYLQNTYQYPIHDSLACYQALNFKQYSRKAFFVDPAYGIPLRDIRRDYRLKSSYFSLSEEGSSVVFSGKGFGHGVGLSQEGAMKMIREGYNHKQVIHFYFTGIHLISFDLLEFYTKDLAEY